MVRLIKKAVSGIIDWILYTLLSEKQKNFLANLFSEQQKNKIKRITNFGKRHSQRQLLKQINTHLYSLGFTDRAYSELTHLLSESTNDLFMKRLVSWELALWHVNQMTTADAEKALKYLEMSKANEKDTDQLRRIAILEAECFVLLQDLLQAKNTIQAQLDESAHPDLYLAMANAEDTISTRVEWMNRAMNFYHLQEITFHNMNDQTIYDDLQTKPVSKQVQTGPKVSVLLPAYNAANGIQIAIESILQQTWTNLELLIVDDCSTDHTVDVVEQYMSDDERIKLFSTPENSGPYVARNIGLQHATGDFITVNDADDWSHAEKIEKQVSHLMEHPRVIANTSEHARLTEELTFYRRGTPGRYIFSNMSSLMFRREPVREKLGYWDSVRFAGDGEFKRRLIRTFGEHNVVDLATGPLSLPRQSVTSLTGSSAFGYNGFFMGARKEYVENLEFYHEQAESLYYPYPQLERPFPVPEPMLPKREEKTDGKRLFDIIVATDFRAIQGEHLTELMELKDAVNRVGLIQVNTYDLKLDTDIPMNVRSLIDGEFMQMIVYGEVISAKALFIIDHTVLLDWQRYIPEVNIEEAHVFMTRETNADQIHTAADHLHHYFGKSGTWYPLEPFDQIPEVESHVKFAKQPLGSLRHHV